MRMIHARGTASPSRAGGPTSSLARTPHLIAAGISMGLLACAVGTLTLLARKEAQSQVYTLTRGSTAHQTQGRALQLAALKRPDLLVLYGSSELNGWYFLANRILSSHRSEFLLFPVGGAPMRSLAIAQRMASLGPAVRQSPVAISISPQWFTEYDRLPTAYFDAAFSRTHAFELVFGSRLSSGLKRRLASRMLEYPQIIQKDQLLALGFRSMATRRPPERLVFYVIWPFGKLDAFVLRILDYLEVLSRTPPTGWPVPSPDGRVDWDQILERMIRERPPDIGLRAGAVPRVLTRNDFLNRVEHSSEWGDLDLLMRVLRELQARPLIIGMPLNGPVYDANGISRSDREIYYQKLRTAVSRYGLPFVDFSEYDGDARFLRDRGGHPSLRGWTYYVRALDEFRRETRP